MMKARTSVNGMLITKQVYENPNSSLNVSQLYDQQKSEGDKRAARLAQIKELVQRGLYEPDLNSLAARILADLSSVS